MGLGTKESTPETSETAQELTGIQMEGVTMENMKMIGLTAVDYKRIRMAVSCTTESGIEANLRTAEILPCAK